MAHAVLRERRPIDVMARGGQDVLTILPESRTTMDQVWFQIVRPNGTAVSQTIHMTAFEFRNFVERLRPAPADSRGYRRPAPPALPAHVRAFERAQMATSWSATQARAVASHVERTWPYLRVLRTDTVQSSGRKTPRHVLVIRDTQKGFTLRASTWRDIQAHVDLRNVMHDNPDRPPRE